MGVGAATAGGVGEGTTVGLGEAGVAVAGRATATSGLGLVDALLDAVVGEEHPGKNKQAARVKARSWKVVVMDFSLA
jgi:hypothetical protein